MPTCGTDGTATFNLRAVSRPLLLVEIAQGLCFDDQRHHFVTHLWNKARLRQMNSGSALIRVMPSSFQGGSGDCRRILNMPCGFGPLAPALILRYLYISSGSQTVPAGGFFGDL